ncbi:adenine nucleotide alpha hydrolase [Sandaracinus amylolyticus]|uniref:adenine nucleotide alpha hydrolase n=1 Tax=Sandaracinus amylolyticus TaxID=927083 RepID=UPI001F347F2F|nr:adenine nucleotide alpha hydrolase [Sandaracinus amylolyticus]UJR81310.1 Adenine nucleotide alpha hydrolase [Sandaracinus amylolyticus]
MKPKAWVSWSSGKDAAWALHVARASGELDVVGLLTTTNEHFDRVAMHGVRRDLLMAQAEATGLPVHVVPLPWPCSNDEYEARMRAALEVARGEGVTHVIFGDLFLEEVRRYRESRLEGTGITPVFPLWGVPTHTLARDMVSAGVRAHIVTLDPRKVPRELAGRVLDHALLDALPEGVDPCGENGETHTFVSAGPMLQRALPVRGGEVVEREGFVYADLMLDQDSQPTPS